MIQPDLRVDKLKLQKEVHFTIEGAPAINIRTGQIEPFSRFHYDTKLYEKPNGLRYYLFNPYDDCTLYIMNCNKDVYDFLGGIIPIDDETEIFEHSPEEKGSPTEFVPIPEDYRTNPGTSGIPVFFTD